MSQYTEKDAAEDTNSSVKEVSEAWHDAREDAQKSGELPEREANKNSSYENDDNGESSSGK